MSLLVALAALLTGVIGIAVEAATVPGDWPWPANLIQKEPWLWVGVILLLMVILAVWMSMTGEKRVVPRGDGGDNATTAGVHNSHNTYHYYGDSAARPPMPALAPEQEASDDGPGYREVPDLPEFVPVAVRDRVDVLERLRAELQDSRTVFLQLVGDPGIGKTAVAAEVARMAPGEVEPIYLAVQGHPGVNAVTVLDRLATAIGDPVERQRIGERIRAPEADFRSKLEDVLAHLGNRQIWLILDDAQDLISVDGRVIRDEMLDSLFAELLVTAREHRTKVLIVTQKPLPLAEFSEVQMIGGLTGDDFDGFLTDLAAAGLSGSADLPSSEVAKATGGIPRGAELVLAAREVTRVRASDLLRAADKPSYWAKVILSALAPSQQRVVRALAALGRPAGPDVVAHLCGDDEGDVRDVLIALTGCRLVRHRGHRFYLPAAEAARLAAFIGDEPVRESRRRAAKYFASRERGTALRLADLEDAFHAIDLYLRADEPVLAVRLADQLEYRHLRSWGHSAVLLPWLQELASGLEGHLPEQVINASLQAQAQAQQGNLKEAIATIGWAGRMNRDPAKQVELVVDLSGYWFRAGQLANARGGYRFLTEHPSGHPVIPFGLAGLARCQVEIGDFTTAREHIAAARAALAELDGKRDSTRRLEIDLLYQRALISSEEGDERAANGLLDEARDRARPDERVREARCDDLEARMHLYRRDHRAAYRLAKRAYSVAAQVGNPSLYSTAGVTLALTELSQGRPSEALAAATVAARYGLRLYAPETLVVQGLASLRCRDVGDRTRKCFMSAVQLTGELLPLAEGSYLLHEARGLALGGLALLHSADEKKAEEAYEAAIAVVDHPGARARRRELFTALIADQPNDVLPELRKLLL
ncbi:AAA family ATPase [Actinoplanes sp. NBC_00393]|uniref:AAA family ATPase n=1 Tax=Actinoplanes sp. NBC_00393 TaxID=2975953 RepID=UPI002E1B4CDB